MMRRKRRRRARHNPIPTYAYWIAGAVGVAGVGGLIYWLATRNSTPQIPATSTTKSAPGTTPTSTTTPSTSTTPTTTPSPAPTPSPATISQAISQQPGWIASTWKSMQSQ
jgi:cytoskeletal protein RodZ